MHCYSVDIMYDSYLGKDNKNPTFFSAAVIVSGLESGSTCSVSDSDIDSAGNEKLKEKSN